MTAAEKMETQQPRFRRNTEAEPNQAGDYYDGNRRYYDQNFEVTVVKLFSGDCYATDSLHEMIVTILGSCVAACVRDPIAGVSGMNHFLLPGDPGVSSANANDAARYGAFAMEQLINKMLALGALKSRMEVKLFGGGNVIDSSAMIGSKNVAFIKKFVQSEGLNVVSNDLGGDYPRRINFFTEDGRVMMRKLKRKDDMRIVAEEKKYEKTLEVKPVEGSIELFG